LQVKFQHQEEKNYKRKHRAHMQLGNTLIVTHQSYNWV